MARTLTAPMIERLKPDPKKRVEVSDALLPALRVVVQPNGSKSFAVRFRRDGRPAKFTIGPTTRFSLAEARIAAREALSTAAKGQDPTALKKISREARAVAARATEDLVENAVEEFLKRHVAKLKSAHEVARLLRAEMKPWHGRRVQDIAKRDVIRLIDAVHDRGAPTTARRLLANAKRFFGWLVERDVLTMSPCIGVKPPSAEVARDRVLTDAELRLVMLATNRLGWPFCPFIKLLALTGARRSEVAGMLWSELRLDGPEPMWSLPPPRTKNGKPHDVPLAAPVLRILGDAPRIRNEQGESSFVFTTTCTTPISGYAKAKALLDHTIAAIRREEAQALGEPVDEPLPPWHLHDLRRTFASGCARLGVALPVVERCLNHVSGSFAGIVGVYQRHDYATEKRDALIRWADHLSRLAAS